MFFFTIILKSITNKFYDVNLLTTVKSSCDRGSWCERNWRGVEGGRAEGGW